MNDAPEIRGQVKQAIAVVEATSYFDLSCAGGAHFVARPTEFVTKGAGVDQLFREWVGAYFCICRSSVQEEQECFEGGGGGRNCQSARTLEPVRRCKPILFLREINVCVPRAGSLTEEFTGIFPNRLFLRDERVVRRR
jgi:hypothetical protein